MKQSPWRSWISTWHDKRPWFDADIDADLSHLNFLQNTYGNEFVGNFIGSSKIKLMTDVLSWDLNDNFGQTPLDPLAPITPGNRENINYLSTGPVLTLPLLGRELELLASGQYGRVDYQQTPLNSNRLTGIVGLLHEMSPTTNVSINAKDERIIFEDEQLNPDYDTQEAFARLDTKGSRTELGIDLGYGHLQLTGTNDNTFIARVDITRRVTPSSTVGLSFGHDYSDGADSFLLVQEAGGAGFITHNMVQAGAPFLITYGTLAWNFQRDRTTLGLTASYFRDEYPNAETLNNDMTLASIRAAREISPVLQLALTEYLDREHFSTGGDSVTEADTGLQLTWRAGKSLSVVFAYYLAKGISDLQVDKYTENRLWLSVGYGRAAQVPPGPAPVRLPGQTAN